MTARPHSTRKPSWRRIFALCRKETLQILRDPSSIVIAFVLPGALLFIFGYGVNLDTARSPIAVIVQDEGPAAQSFATALANTSALRAHRMRSVAAAEKAMLEGDIRGYVVISDEFSENLAQGAASSVFVGTDGSQPNTASFVAGNVRGVWNKWYAQWRGDEGLKTIAPIGVESRSWYNPSAESRNGLIPGSIVIIMTILGALLTSLVVAREWERGTMEALLAAGITRVELLLSKLIPYYSLAMIAMVICMAIAVLGMGVPFRGSLPVLLLVTTLFLGSTLGLGLLISTVTRNQFNAAQAALNVGYMPAVMLSGFVFEIASMAKLVQFVAHVLPASHFMSSLQTLFQAGVVWPALLPGIGFLTITTLFFIGMTLKKTQESLE
jgi:ABC-2 type transport system permease protein